MSGYCDICGNTLCVCDPGSEVEALRTEVARLRDERDELRAQIADADRALGANVRRLVEAHGGIEVRRWDWREADTLDEAVVFLVAELEGE